MVDYKRCREVAIEEAQKFGASLDDAEDIAHTAIESVLTGDETIRNTEAWVRVLARNLAIDHYRRSQALLHEELPSYEYLDEADVHSLRGADFASPDAVVGAEHTMVAVIGLRDGWPPKVRQIWDLAQLDRSTEEIADEVGTTAGSVRVILSVLRRSLRRTITDN